MLNAQSSSPAPEWFDSYQANLPLLLHTLRNAGWLIGTDTLLNVQQLLLRLQAMAQLPATPAQLSAYLQPLLCSREFASLYHGWCNQWYGQSITEGADSPRTNSLQENATPSVSVQLVIKKLGSSPLFDFSDAHKQLWLRGIAAALLSIVILLVGVYLGLPEQPTKSAEPESVTSTNSQEDDDSTNPNHTDEPPASSAANPPSDKPETVVTKPQSLETSENAGETERPSPETKKPIPQEQNESPSKPPSNLTNAPSAEALSIPIQPVPLRQGLQTLILSPEAEQQLALYQQLFRWLPVVIIGFTTCAGATT